jgi:hypothetical protein
MQIDWNIKFDFLVSTLISSLKTLSSNVVTARIGGREDSASKSLRMILLFFVFGKIETNICLLPPKPHEHSFKNIKKYVLHISHVAKQVLRKGRKLQG